MTTPSAESQRTLALRGTWHIVRGDRTEGARVGRLYVFRCSRWAREADIQGIARGTYPTGDELCIKCREDEEGLLGEASGVPGPSSDEEEEFPVPQGGDWDPDAAPNRTAFLER